MAASVLLTRSIARHALAVCLGFVFFVPLSAAFHQDSLAWPLRAFVVVLTGLSAAVLHRSVDAAILAEWVVNVGRRDARARIAHLLCELVERLRKIGAGQEGMFDFPLTQEQLADATGLTAVHTNRTLQSLRKDGLIQLTAKSLTVLDWDRLREVADFDELYLHQQA